MLLIPQVQLPHINFDMRELTIGEAIGLVKLNPSAHEHTISQFLTCVLTGNGRALTVQERYLLVAQYISATCQGESDFPIGDTAKYSDYLRMNHLLSLEPIALGFDEDWQLSPLFGWQAEALEDICKSWQDWIFGCMAAQLTNKNDTDLPTLDTPIAAYQSWLKERIAIFKAYPERDFAELYHAFLFGFGQFNFYFDLGFDNEGLVCLHKEGQQGFAPARFQVSDCLTATAISFG